MVYRGAVAPNLREEREVAQNHSKQKRTTSKAIMAERMAQMADVDARVKAQLAAMTPEERRAQFKRDMEDLGYAMEGPV